MFAYEIHKYISFLGGRLTLTSFVMLISEWTLKCSFSMHF